MFFVVSCKTFNCGKNLWRITKKDKEIAEDLNYS